MIIYLLSQHGTLWSLGLPKEGPCGQGGVRAQNWLLRISPSEHHNASAQLGLEEKRHSLSQLPVQLRVVM